MSPRFQADADLDFTIVLALLRREPGIDFRSAVSSALAGIPDEEVLHRSAADGRILVSHDRRTMPHAWAGLVAAGAGPGLILVPQSMPVVQAAEELLLIWSATEASEWIDRIVVLPL